MSLRFHLHCLYLICILTWSGLISNAQDTRATVNRALTFIQLDAVKWRQEKTCSTCHHGTMTMWVQLEAKTRGYEIEENEFQENVRWAKQRIMERADLPRDTRPGWNMVNTPAMYLSIMAQAVPQQSIVTDDDLSRISGHLLRHQEENGAWIWSSAPRKNAPPPYFESDEVATRLAVMALAARSIGDGPDASAIRSSIARAEEWLKLQSLSNTTQAQVIRLWMRHQIGTTVSELQGDVDELKRLQNMNGGWSQVPDGESDAYATGQVLSVLSLVGLPSTDLAIQDGIAFLVRTQQQDGSWPMKKRVHPGETPTENVIPITYLGTSWATLGLIRTTDSPSSR